MKYGLKNIAMRNLVAMLDRIIEGWKLGEKYCDLLFSAYGFGSEKYTDHKLEVFLKCRYIFVRAQENDKTSKYEYEFTSGGDCKILEL